MRTSPSIAPRGSNQDTYVVLDDFGPRLGRTWREINEDAADRETLIRTCSQASTATPFA
jgi:hypothetical protein